MYSIAQEVSGGFAEADVFGRCRAPYQGRRPWEVEIELVRKCQPTKKTCALLALEREFERRGFTVKFYTAVGSGLDRHYGTDCFCESSEGCVVTIDYTTNPSKCTTAADMLVRDDEFENLPHLVVRIAKMFLSKSARAA